MNASVYDLGVAMEEGWLVFHTHWTPGLFLIDFGIYSGRILLSPIFQFRSFELILIIQTIALALPSVFIYGISKIILKRKLLALLIALAYLIYFPLSGINLFDFHYMAFFPLFFISGCYFYFRNKFNLSFILFLLSGLIKFPFIVFPIVFLLLNLKVSFLKPLHYLSTSERKKQIFTIITIFAFTLLLALSYYSVSLIGVSTYLHSGPFLLNNIQNDLDNKIFTILLIFFPFLLLPLFSKYSILLIPIIFFDLFLDGGFTYPGLFLDQYSAVLVPFVFLSFIDALSKFGGNDTKSSTSKDSKPSQGKQSRKYTFKMQDKYVIALVISLILFATVFQPYGPLNTYTQENHFASSYADYNITIFNYAVKVASLIPSNVSASDILIENNLPFIFPRIDTYGLNISNPLSAPLEIDYNYNFFYNYTELGPNGFVPIIPDYIMMYPYGGVYNQGYWGYSGTDGPYPHNISNANLINYLTSKYHYGLLAEADGIFLLEKNYSGPLKYYVPFSYYYPATYFNAFSPYSNILKNTIVANNVSKEGLFWGPTVIIPGSYQVRFYFNYISNSTNNSIELHIASDYGLKNIADLIYNLNSTGEGSFTVSFNITVQHIVSYGIYSTYVNYWGGELIFKGISVNQIAPPQE
ncbi:MAG: DUF2079 domain-containing protein [Candidatus Micrarchaeaceae archaeon]